MMSTMTNVNDNSLFEQDNCKHEFLSEMNPSTARSYERIFGYTKIHEKALNKDIRYFEFEELETILYGFKSNNRNTVETYGRIISSYLNWCVKRQYSKENPLSILNPSDFEKYLTNEESYISEKELKRYEDKCANAQDAIILRLSFVGVGGKQMSEIRNLKKQDIDWDNKRLHLIETLKADEKGLPIKYTERFLDVDDRTLELLKEAIEQVTYEKRNGKMDYYDNIRDFTDLVYNDYVIRASITNKDDEYDVPVDKHVCYRRIKIISETLKIKKLTSKYLQRSGMMYYANELIKNSKGPSLTLDDMKVIASRFNVKSYHNLKGFLNLENIQQTYPK